MIPLPRTGPGPIYYPSMEQPSLQPQSRIVRMLSQELAAAQRRLSQYTDLIANLYAELEVIHGILCNNCKQRVYPENLAPFASAGSHSLGIQQTTPAVPPQITPGTLVASPFSSSDANNHNADVSRQTNLMNSRLTPSCLTTSPMPATFSDTPFIPSNDPIPEETESSLPRSQIVADIAAPMTGVSQWSVVYNNDIEKALDITFIHAFKHEYPVHAARFSPDGNFLAVGLEYDRGKTFLYNVNTKSIESALTEYPGFSEKRNSPRHAIWCLCFSPDGRYLAVGYSFNTVYIWDISRKKVLAGFKGHTNTVWSLDFSPDGRSLITCSYDYSLRIWKMRDGSSKLLSKERRLFTSVKFSPNGRYIAASNNDRFLRLWDVRSGQLVGLWNGHKERIRRVVFTPDGEKLVSGDWHGTMRSWDVSSLKTLVLQPSTAEDPAWEDHKLEFEGHLEELRSVSISTDGKWVITGSSDNGVSIWDMHTGVQQCKLEGHASALWAVDFSPIEDYIATGSEDGFVTLWRYKSV